MFSRNLGDEVLSVASMATSVQGCATRDSKTGDLILKLVNPQPTATPLTIEIKGVASVGAKAGAIILGGNSEDTNSINHPRSVVPLTATVRAVKPRFDYSLPPSSIVVMRIKTRA
jgi:alpha-N-arabinofuranosidase